MPPRCTAAVGTEVKQSISVYRAVIRYISLFHTHYSLLDRGLTLIVCVNGLNGMRQVLC